MPPLITPDEALIERASCLPTERFADSTDLCSRANAKSGECAEDGGFCAQSPFAEAETPLHAQLRFAKKSPVPSRPDGAPNRGLTSTTP
jgi:biotin synthase-like enzyme